MAKGEVVAVPRHRALRRARGGQARERSMVLDGDFFRIGSHPSNDLVLDDRARLALPLQHRARDAHGLRLDGHGLAQRHAHRRRPRARRRLPPARVPHRARRLGRARPRAQRRQRDRRRARRSSFGALYGVVAPDAAALRIARARRAQSDADVLIEGESGTGKELVATEIVQRGAPRRQAARRRRLRRDLAEPHRERALRPRARRVHRRRSRDRVGAFEAADGGTVFLDEIGELPLELQPKLLRALEAREVRRVGESRVRKVDVRVIAATNRRLEREVNSGRFREDLYYRLAVLTVRVPPLRERLGRPPAPRSTLPRRRSTRPTRRTSSPPRSSSEMTRYDWPGNVRELRNYVERRVVLEHRHEGARRPTAAPPPSAAPLGRRARGASRGRHRAALQGREGRVIDGFERAYLTALLALGRTATSAAPRARRSSTGCTCTACSSATGCAAPPPSTEPGMPRRSDRGQPEAATLR